MEIKTEGNLQEAFAGESKANRRYLFFAEKADKEGYPQIARLFQAAGVAETVHARNHLENIGGVGSTEGNLETAIKGEHYEFTKMYPDFIEQAKADNSQPALVAFEYANAVEKIHHQLYQKMLEALKAGEKLKDEPYFICQVCGNTAAGKAPGKCSICGAPRNQFRRVG